MLELIAAQTTEFLYSPGPLELIPLNQYSHRTSAYTVALVLGFALLLSWAPNSLSI